MRPNATHIAHLFYGYQAGELSSAEMKEWEAFIHAYPAAAQFLLDATENRAVIDAVATHDPKQAGVLEQQMLTDIRYRIAQAKSTVISPAVHRVHFLKTAWFRCAAAIILFIGVGVAGYYIVPRKDNNATVQTEKPTTPVPAANILPGSNKAILTLSDGKRVELDSAASGTISDRHLSIENRNGQLTYGASNLVAYNTMTTPRGGQYQLILADGTKVWLNAASSITYPTAFTGKMREVIITGEAYFEVKANKEKPFIVKAFSDEITVLGTSFNINAYSDEETVKTTLIEGAVKVNNTNIKPGQAYQHGKVVSTNVKQDVAWKNGYFDFDNANWASALRQLARWYNIEINIQGSLPTSRLKGKVGRDLTLGQVLDLLSETGLKTALKGNILTVLP